MSSKMNDYTKERRIRMAKENLRSAQYSDDRYMASLMMRSPGTKWETTAVQFLTRHINAAIAWPGNPNDTHMIY
jgi:hypothetical protein